MTELESAEILGICRYSSISDTLSIRNVTVNVAIEGLEARMVRIASILTLFAILFSACQKNTYELANADSPEKAPQYTVTAERNGVAAQ